MSHAASSSSCMQIAEHLCRQRGVRLTRQRRKVLAIINSSEQAMGAYDILHEMRAAQPRIAPPTVYRALEFLLSEGLIPKLESLHAFVGCAHPDHPHLSQFLICNECGAVDELHNDSVNHSLTEAARAKGFLPERRTVEVVGRCDRCQSGN